MTHPPPVVRLERLVKLRPSGFRRKRRVVDDLSFDLAPGEVAGLLGHNGAGKSTTMRILLGLAHPTAGEALVFGAPLAERPDLRRRVAYLPENARFHPYLTPREIIAFAAALEGRPAPPDLAESLLERVGLAPALADRRLETFSKGMQQRLALALVELNPDAGLLVLDEPATGLDPAGRRLLRDLVRRRAAAGAAVLLSSHDLAEVGALCDRLLVIREGRLLADTPTAALGLPPPPRTLEDYYLDLMGEGREKGGECGALPLHPAGVTDPGPRVPSPPAVSSTASGETGGRSGGFTAAWAIPESLSRERPGAGDVAVRISTSAPCDPSLQQGCGGGAPSCLFPLLLDAWRALARDRLGLALAACALALIALARLSGGLALELQSRVLKDLALACVSMSAFALFPLAAVHGIRAEIERGTLGPLLARPVGRGAFLAARFLAVAAAAALFVALLSAELWLLLLSAGGHGFGAIAGAVFLIWLKVLPVVALAVALAPHLGRGSLFAVALGVGLAGHLAQGLAHAAGEAVPWLGSILGFVFGYLLPDYTFFAVDFSMAMPAGFASHLLQLAVYSGSLTALYLMAGAWAFGRQDL